MGKPTNISRGGYQDAHNTDDLNERWKIRKDESEDEPKKKKRKNKKKGSK